MSQILRRYLTKEGRVRKFLYCLIWIKEFCVRKFEGLTLSKILGISQTKLKERVGRVITVFYSNPCSIKSVEYLKLLFISLGSPLVALERDIFKLTKGCLMSEKTKPK